MQLSDILMHPALIPIRQFILKFSWLDMIIRLTVCRCIDRQVNGIVQTPETGETQSTVDHERPDFT